MDTKVKGIVLKTTEYKESDKLLTILTLEKGKILVNAKGVKKAKSKFKAFAQSFCFADFELSSNQNGGYILTGVQEIENFFDLTSNIEKFEYAFAIIEIADKICREGVLYPRIFLSILKSLQELKREANPKLVLTKFMLDVIKFEGIEINFDKCASCKTPLLQDNVFLDLPSGEMKCRACKNFDCLELEKSWFSALKIVSNNEYEKLKTIRLNDNILNNTLSVILKYLCYKFDIVIKSIFV